MPPKCNAPCPCGSGHKFKKCHGRVRTSWQKRMWDRLQRAFSP